MLQARPSLKKIQAVCNFVFYFKYNALYESMIYIRFFEAEWGLADLAIICNAANLSRSHSLQTQLWRKNIIFVELRFASYTWKVKWNSTEETRLWRKRKKKRVNEKRLVNVSSEEVSNFFQSMNAHRTDSQWSSTLHITYVRRTLYNFHCIQST